MMRASRTAVVAAIWWAAVGFAPSALAADVCGEIVPANRFIDGFPAYAQCTGSSSASIYSNNGIDTSTTNAGAGWVRTQDSGGYQCTELAHRYLHFRWNVTSVPNGNAGVWCAGNLPTGLVKTTAPVHGDLIVLAPGSCGADATTGHVAVVDVVNADLSVSAVQQNSAGRGKYSSTCAACFLHVIANDGSGTPDAGTSNDAAPLDAGTDMTADAPANDAATRDATTPPAGSGGTAEPMGTGGRGGGAAGGAPGTGGVHVTATGGAPPSMATGGASGSTGGAPGAAPNDTGSGCACAVNRGAGTGDHPGGQVAANALAALLFVIAKRRRAGQGASRVGDPDGSWPTNARQADARSVR